MIPSDMEISPSSGSSSNDTQGSPPVPTGAGSGCSVLPSVEEACMLLGPCFPFERVVGLRSPSYVSLSYSYHLRSRHVTLKNKNDGAH